MFHSITDNRKCRMISWFRITSWLGRKIISGVWEKAKREPKSWTYAPTLRFSRYAKPLQFPFNLRKKRYQPSLKSLLGFTHSSKGIRNTRRKSNQECLTHEEPLNWLNMLKIFTDRNRFWGVTNLRNALLIWKRAIVKTESKACLLNSCFVC